MHRFSTLVTYLDFSFLFLVSDTSLKMSHRERIQRICQQGQSPKQVKSALQIVNQGSPHY